MATDNDIIARLVLDGVSEFKAELQSTTTDTAKVKANVKEIGTEGTKAFGSLTVEAEKADTSIQEVTKSTTSYKTQLKQMRQEIVTLTIDMEKMRSAGKAGTDEFNKLDSKIKTLTNNAGQLDDAIRDVSSTVKNAGSDTRGLDKALRAVTSLSAGFQIAQGAASLLGDDNKELAQGLIKLNGIMAITSGLQQLQNEYTRNDSIFTSTATKAKGAYASATAFAAQATGLLRIALVGLGLTAVIGLIYLAVKAYEAFSDSSIKATRLAEAEKSAREKSAESTAKELVQLDLLQESLKDENISRKQKQELIASAKQQFPEVIGRLKDEAFYTDELTTAIKKQKDIIELRALAKGAEDLITEKTKEILKKSLSNPSFSDIVKVGFVSIFKGIPGAIVDNIAKPFQDINALKEVFKKALSGLNEAGATLDPAKGIKDKITKSLKDFLPIKITYEISSVDFDKKFSDLISKAEAELKSLFTAELLLGNNPQENPQIRYLITQLDVYKKKLEETKLQFDALNPSAIKPVGLQDVTDSANPLAGINKKTVVKPLTFWDKIFGTKKENETRQEEILRNAKGAKAIIEQVSQFAEGVANVASQAINIRAQNELQALEDKKNRGLVSQKEYEKQSAKIKNDAAEKQREVEIAMAIAKIPQAVLAAYISGFEFGGPVAAGILAGVAGAFAFAQVAVLTAAPLPKFKDGGSVEKRLGLIKGKSHNAGGEKIEVEGNEFVVKGDAVKKYGVKFFDEVNSLKYNPIISMPKKAMANHKRDTKMYEHMAIISSYLKQGYGSGKKGNKILSEISGKLNNKAQYV